MHQVETTANVNLFKHEIPHDNQNQISHSSDRNIFRNEFYFDLKLDSPVQNKLQHTSK